MTSRDGREEYGLPIAELISILLNKWWVVLVVLLATLIASGAASLRANTPDPDPVFESKTVLQIGSLETSGLRYRLSSEFITAISSSGELLEEIRDELDLRDNSGDPMPILSLRGMIKLALGTDNLTAIVHGNTPEQAHAIVSKWSDLFIESLSELQGNGDSESIRDEKSAFKQSNAIIVLERSITELEEKNQLVVDRQSERYVVSATVNLEALQAEMNVVLGNYRTFLDAVVDDKANLIHAQAELVQNTDALANENPVIIIERQVSDTVLLPFLAGSPTLEEIDGLRDLVLVEEERNDLYYTLRQDLLDNQLAVTVLKADIDHAKSEIVRLNQEIIRLNILIEDQKYALVQFDQETTRLLTKMDKETASDTARYNEVFANLLRQFDDDLATIGVQHEINNSASVQTIENPVQGVEMIPEQGSTQRSVFTVLSVGGVIGLFLGVMAAFTIYYVQRAVQAAR